MEALLVSEIPTGPEWRYEPKWDGFRCLAYRDGTQVELQSKSGQSLTRYFPELVGALKTLKAPRFVLDGELAIPEGDSLSFDQLLQRIHPAASRIERLAQEHSAVYILFDLLVAGAEPSRGAAPGKTELLIDRPLAERRTRLEHWAKQNLNSRGRLLLSPWTDQLKTAREWLSRTGNDLDGLVAKRSDLPYQSGKRTGMQKIKRRRTADCVIGGFRYGEDSQVVGSLLLGLYDEQGKLNHVGFCSGIKAAERPSLTRKLETLIQPPGFTGQTPGGPSRWSTRRSAEWQPLTPTLVVEVEFDHFTGGRFRHGTKLVRWRPDKSPDQCRCDQIEPTRPGVVRWLREKKP